MLFFCKLNDQLERPEAKPMAVNVIDTNIHTAKG